MIDYLVIALVCAAAIGLLHRFKLIAHSKTVLATTRKAGAIAKDASLSELEKERQTQAVAKQLLTQFFHILIAGGAAFVLPLLPLYLLDVFELVDIGHILELMSSVGFILLFLVVFIVTSFRSLRG